MRRSPRGLSQPCAQPRKACRLQARGYVLVEVLVTVLLLAMVVGALLPLLTSGQQGFDYASRRLAMTRAGRTALDKLVREMRAAASFRTLGPGQVSFTMQWGDGTGAQPTVEYSLNASSHNLEYRWNANWDYREQLTVRAPNSVPSGYAVALAFNHAALVATRKSLASGDDVRVRYWNGSSMVELDRILDPASAWNGLATTIWFRLQAPIGVGASDANYYLFYGNLADANPPAYGPNVFLDYQDGTALDGWIRRDGLPGAYSPSVANGFVFQAAAGNGFRELTKNVPHGDVEIFWGFWSAASDHADGHDAGIGARLSDTGAGYRVTVADQTNTTLRIRYWPAWSQNGGVIRGAAGPTLPGRSYFGRFYLVGTSLRAKYWPAGTPEPPLWQLSAVDARVAAGNHYGLLDGFRAPENHNHRTVIIRPRVALEPIVTLGPETSGARADALVALAGPFRSLTVACFDALHASIACSPTPPVRSVQVSLVVMDPASAVPDMTLTDLAYRQTP
jgi:type II secretory pathway pseudopilin PulG